MQSFLLSLQQFFCHRMAKANWKFWNRLCILLLTWFRHISKADLLPICYGFMYISENCYSIVFCYFGLYRRIKVRLRDAVFEMQAQFCPPCTCSKTIFYSSKDKTKTYFFFHFMRTKFTKCKWLKCKYYGVHWYVLHFYVPLKHNKYTTTCLNTCKEQRRRVVIICLCFSYAKPWWIGQLDIIGNL